MGYMTERVCGRSLHFLGENMSKHKFIKLLKKHNYFFNRRSKGHGLYTNVKTKHTIMVASKHKVFSSTLVKKILKETGIL